MRQLHKILLALFFISACIVITASAQDTLPAQTFPFTSEELQGAKVLQQPSSLQFGPDGRLYVAQVNGTIRIFTIIRSAKGLYRVTHTQTVDLIQNIQNHDDDGQPQAYIQRQVTGILVTGTADHPVIYATSSDYRQSLDVGDAVDNDSKVDTNSGVISRLTWEDSDWQKLDLVRGLPRSPLDHATNGMALDAATNTLYVAQGGNSNMGASLNDNDITPEYAYSAAILTIDLNAIGDTTYDLPTLDDPNRPGNPDANDPFGGDGGLNQAMIVPDSPVQVYATGFRNPYDLVLTQTGRLYTITNGANGGWGGPPTDCSNDTGDIVLPSDPGSLHLVTKGYYAGHPNPTRGSAANLFAGQSPIVQADPQECSYIPPAETHALALWDGSTNGLTEYTASNFGGALKGSLLAADFSGLLRHIGLNSTGDAVVQNDVLFSNFGDAPLDVTTRGDHDPFPGTIWVAVLGANKIQVFEPLDYQGAQIDTGKGASYSFAKDDDGDGYSNGDEIDNGIDPLNPASRPPDFDGDHLSNLNDHDDDNDGIDDVNDPFALDPANGTATQLPINYTWDRGNPGTGLLGTGFTGLMMNHQDDYSDLFTPDGIIAGGANGWLTIENVAPGDPILDSNDQRDGLQFGVPNQGAFTVRTRLLPPFFNSKRPQPFQSEGVYVGTGDMDNYAKLILTSYGFQSVYEAAGKSTEFAYQTDLTPFLNAAWIDLYLYSDGQGAIYPYYVTSAGAQLSLLPIRPGWLANAQTLAVGILATSKDAPEFTSSWDFLTVQAGQDRLLAAIPIATAAPTTLPIQRAPGVCATCALIEIAPPPGDSPSTYEAGSFRIHNLSTGGQQIVSAEFDISNSLLPDTVFDPDGTKGDNVGKPFTVDQADGLQVTGSTTTDRTLSLQFANFDPGKTLTFSMDVDPTSMKGAIAPGPDGAASVDGLELIDTKVTLTFSDGTQRTTWLYHLPGSDIGSGNSTDIPSEGARLKLTGTTSQDDRQVVSFPNLPQILLTGKPGDHVLLLVTFGTYHTDDTLGASSYIYAFNSVDYFTEQSFTIPESGSLEIPVAFKEPGIYIAIAVVQDPNGAFSRPSNRLTMAYTS